MKGYFFLYQLLTLLEQKNTGVHFCREIVCVKMFLRHFFHGWYYRSVAQRHKYVLILESSGWLKAARALGHLQPTFSIYFVTLQFIKYLQK